jgi:periplasmic copper chaperone A
MLNSSLRAALLALPMLATSAFAHDYKVGDLKIEHPWTRATPGGAKVAGGFMKITNTGKETDRLTGGSADIANVFEVHEMAMEGNVMKMRALVKGLEIKPGQSIELKPGSYHVMFIDLKNPIQEGKPFKGFLTFEKAGKIEVEYKIEKMGTTKAGNGEHKH